MQAAEADRGGSDGDGHHRLLGEVADQVLHELGNRLAVARMVAEVLDGRDDLPPALAAPVSALLGATDAAGQVVLGLATLAGRRSGPAHAVDLGVVLTELRPLLGAALGDRLEVAEPAAAPVLADRLAMEELVLRLVLGGHRRAEGAVAVTIGRDGGTVSLEVARPAADPVEAAARARASELAERAGGDLTERVRGDGVQETTVRLPAAPAEGVPDGSEPGDPRSVDRSAGGTTVLVVEDDIDLRSLLRSALEADGHSVAVVGDAQAALAHPLVAAGGLDLLITDVELPGSSGLGLAARLMESGTRVVVMSGHGAAGLGDGVPPGALVLDKPFGIPALLARAREALASDPGPARR